MGRCIVATVALLALLVGACEHGDPLVDGGDGSGPEMEPTLPNIQTNVFNTSCAISNCHVGSGAAGGLNLSEGSAREELVGVESAGASNFLRVDPGNADDSYLVMKLEGDSRIIGARMPFNRPPLSSSVIDVIRKWIDDGAD